MQIFEATINKLRPEQIDGFVFLMTSKIQDKNRCYNHNFKNLLYMLFLMMLQTAYDLNVF